MLYRTRSFILPSNELKAPLSYISHYITEDSELNKEGIHTPICITYSISTIILWRLFLDLIDGAISLRPGYEYISSSLSVYECRSLVY